MFFGEEDSPFQNLPPEMIVEVFSSVNLEGKKEGRLVCRRWRWILDHSDSRLLCFKPNLRATNQSRRKISDVDIKCLLKSQLHIKKLELENIKMTWPVMTYSRNKFPPVRKIKLYSDNSEETVITTLQYGCAETVYLTLDYLCFNHVRPDILSRTLSGIRWNQLSELKLRVRSHVPKYDDDEKHAAGIELIFKKAKITHLKILRFYVDSYEENEISPGLTKLMAEFTTFIERHSNTLKGLGLHICLSSDDSDDTETFPHIPAPLFLTELQENVSKNLRLESLEISASHSDTLIYLMPPFVWKADKLTKLTWMPFGGYLEITPRLVAPPGIPQPLQLLVQRNLNTLIDVNIFFIEGNIDTAPFHISWLQSCTALSELKIDRYHKMLKVQVLLPTVRKLEVKLHNSFGSIGDLSPWITQTFQNLETVHLKQIFLGGNRDRNPKLIWLKNLLILPMLRRISFTICYRGRWTVQDLIRQFCNGKPRLVFKFARRERQWVINILPSN